MSLCGSPVAGPAPHFCLGTCSSEPRLWSGRPGLMSAWPGLITFLSSTDHNCPASGSCCGPSKQAPDPEVILKISVNIFSNEVNWAMQTTHWVLPELNDTIILCYSWQDSGWESSSIMIISGLTYVFLMWNNRLRCTVWQYIIQDSSIHMSQNIY